MVSKAFPYMVSAFRVNPPLDKNFAQRDIDEHVAQQQALGDELEEWCKVNCRGKWQRVMLEFNFRRKEDAAMFRLRVGDGSWAMVHPKYG
jgi:hypothetical protein